MKINENIKNVGRIRGVLVFSKLFSSEAQTSVKALGHINTKELSVAIKSSEELTGRWGLFATTNSNWIAKQWSWVQRFLTLQKNTGAVVKLSEEAALNFEKIPVNGIFTALTRAAGWRHTLLGTVKIESGGFMQNLINGRVATFTDKALYFGHTLLIYSGMDVLFSIPTKILPQYLEAKGEEYRDSIEIKIKE